MFIPKFFKVDDINEITHFLNKNAFGILISISNGKPIASHIPFTVTNNEDRLILRGHLANANQQIKDLNSDVMVIFQGPHAYVSSSWYDHENVSTWNYEVVHIYGKSRVLSEEELRSDLINLLDKYESGRENAKTWDNLDESSKKQIKGITGFEIIAGDIQAAFKMSQNRNEQDYHEIITQLETAEDTLSKEVAKEMRRLKDNSSNH